VPHVGINQHIEVGSRVLGAEWDARHMRQLNEIPTFRSFLCKPGARAVIIHIKIYLKYQGTETSPKESSVLCDHALKSNLFAVGDINIPRSSRLSYHTLSNKGRKGRLNPYISGRNKELGNLSLGI
jgi:hypothetical protein